MFNMPLNQAEEGHRTISLMILDISIVKSQTAFSPKVNEIYLADYIFTVK